MQAIPFGLTEVRLLAGPFQDAMQRDHQFLLATDPERLLHMFRVTAGLPSAAEPYGGWEAPTSELRGHSLGHYLSACALMYATTDDVELRRRVDHIVAALGECQAALPAQGYTPGYLSAYPEEFFERVERRAPVWAPYYTLHKILAGLLDAYTHCGSTAALEVAERLAAWIKTRTDRLDLEQMQIMLGMEPGGIDEALANLYALTGKPEHLALALRFGDEAVMGPLAQGVDQLDRLHANTQIPKAIGAARKYELTGAQDQRRAATFFWERVALHRSYALGGNSDDELFFPVDRFRLHLSPVTAETCNTYNMLKLTRHLFSWEPSAQTMDFYERGLFNHILGSQDPATGMMIYFASLKPGHVKIYNTPDNSWWCCTGTGMENHATYGNSIYFHADASLWINLFIASELRWAAKGLTLRQETRFPEQETTRLTLRCAQPVQLALKLRWPAWAERVEIMVNGQTEAIEGTPGAYVTLERTWRDGDVVDVRLPLRLRLEPLPHAADVAAVLYGPIVLAGALGTDNLPDEYLKEQYTRMTATNDWPTPEVPSLLGPPDAIVAGIEPAADQPLTFRTNGIGRPNDVELVPFYRLHHQRYTVYWRIEPAETEVHAG